MSDPYFRIANSALGRAALRRLSLPIPVPLRRYRPGEPLTDGPVLLLNAADDLAEVVHSLGVDVHTRTPPDGCAAVVLDARGVRSSRELDVVPRLLSPIMRSLRPHARVVTAGLPPNTAATTSAAVAQRALEGSTRSLGRELRDGATSNLVQIEPGAEHDAQSALRFLLSGRSAYVSGQVVRVTAAPEPPAPIDWDRPLDSTVALVTGAANGIGASIARVLSRDGAQVVCVDTPAQNDALRDVAASIGGHPLSVDLTDSDAADRIAAHLRQAHDGVDVVVHNAGITRDKTLVRMDADRWSSVLDVNLTATERLTEAVLADGLLREGGAIVATSSINGIAGNRGQTNYAASKAGVIGLVDALAASLRDSGRRINAVAPGFIETRLTARMPAFTREVARRLNSLGQGGQPIDVAETVAWLAAPATAGVNGQTIRVCGQALLGA